MSPRLNLLNIYARGADDALTYHRHDNNSIWRRVDGTRLASSPAGTSDDTGRELLFARIGDGLSMMTVTGADTATPAWGHWTSLGPIAPPAAPIAAPVTTAPPVVTLQTLAPALSFNFKAFKRQTRLSSLVVKAVPAGSTVTVRCLKGCSAKSFTKRGAKGSVSLARFVKRPLKVGTTMTVVVSKRGRSRA